MTAARPDTWMPGRWQKVAAARAGLWGVPDTPNLPGVYVIYFGDELVYIGQSNNIRARFARHNIRYGYAQNIITPWGDVPESVGVFAKIKPSKRLGDWAMWEIRLIHRLQPRLNKTFTGSRWRGAA